MSESPTACRCDRDARRVDVLGVPIDALSADDALQRVEAFLSCPHAHVINHVSVDPIVLAQKDPALSSALRGSDLNLPDGVGVVYGARVFGAKELQARVCGPDFMLDVMRHGVERGWRHGLLGGSSDTIGRLIERLEAAVPGVRLAASYDPPFREVTPSFVAQDLGGLKADVDVVWVGLGSPKQQLWAHMARGFCKARLIVTVGAAFDFLSGAKRRAPRWMQLAGLEWLFRFVSEPRRLWRRYLLGNSVYVLAVARSAWAARRSR